MTDSRNPPAPIREVAKAIYDAMGRIMGPDTPDDWADIGPEHDTARAEWCAVAASAISKLRELGMFHPDALAAIKTEERANAADAHK